VKVALNILIASVLLALAGCKVGPDYHSPETKMPAQWASSPTNADAASSTNPAVVAATWWETFHDAELNSLIARAVSSNLDLRMANARVREARAARGIVAGRLWPTADASGSYQRERISQRGFPTFPPGIKLEDNVYQAGFDSTWELDVFGGQRRSVEAANAEIGAAEESRRSVMVSLLGEVARNYVEARGFQERLAIAQDNIKAQREAVRLTRDRFNSGLTSELDVQQATVLLANTEAEVPTFETGFRVACYSLAVLTAQEPGALVSELSEAKPVPPVPPVVPAGLPSELLQRRPDIRRAERELAATTARIGAAKADLFPKFSLTGSVGLQSVTASDWFTGASRFWSAGPTAQWRIFDAGQIRSNIRLQDARQEEALANYEQTVLSSMQDVESALTGYAKEQVRRRSLGEAVQAGQRALQLSEQLYKNGLADYLQVLDSQRSLYANEDALAESDRTVAVNLVALYKALGGGWEGEEKEAMK